MKKASIIIILLFSIKVLNSCIGDCNCPEVTILNFTINSLELTLLDNSEHWTQSADSNENFHPKAFGFQIELRDTSIQDEFLYMSHHYNPNPSFGFSTAFATSCYCDYYDYQVSQYIDSISVISLLDFSNDTPAGTNISNILLAKQSNDYGGGLYNSLCDLIENINSEPLISSPNIEFHLYLAEAPEYAKGQFKINIHLNDGATVSRISPMINFLQDE